MVTKPEVDKFVALMNAKPHKLVSRRMKFGVCYGDIFISASVERNTLALNTEEKRIRDIPLQDISRIDFMSSGAVRLMYLVDKLIEIGPATYENGTEELDGIIFVPV